MRGTSLRRSAAALPASATLVCLLAAAAPATAQPLPSSVLACRAETDGTRRLACYDREIARAAGDSSVPGHSPVVAAGSPVAEGSPRAGNAVSAENEFGGQPRLAPKRSDKQGAPPELRRLKVQVDVVSRLPHGRIALRLRNGQLWEQSEDGPDLEIKPGDTVTIDRGVLGAYWLWLRTDRLSIKVRRLR